MVLFVIIRLGAMAIPRMHARSNKPVDATTSQPYEGHKVRTITALVLACTLAATSNVALAADAPKRAELSKAEATVVAHRFLANEIAMEASLAEPSQRGDYWVFPLKVGYAGTVAKDPVLVNRYTGVATWAGLDERKARSSGGKQGTPK